MSDRFWPVHSDQEPWFRIGRLEMTTTNLVVAATVVSWLLWAVFYPWYSAVLAFAPGELAGGQVWRVVTWPFSAGLSLWAILDAVMLWYFGNMIEQLIGRRRMAWLLVGVWASLTVAYAVVALLFSGSGVLSGIGTIQLLVLLLWIAEYPTARFFFNIPAWVFGAVILGLQVLSMLAFRMWDSLLALVFALVLVAIAGRRSGLLADYPWIPGRPRAPRDRRPRTSRGQTRVHDRHASDRQRLDELLDQINDQGIGSLTDAQRKELLKLRERLRRD
jgi:membrane associated rhomboid family serine protease